MSLVLLAALCVPASFFHDPTPYLTSYGKHAVMCPREVYSQKTCWSHSETPGLITDSVSLPDIDNYSAVEFLFVSVFISCIFQESRPFHVNCQTC